MLSPSRSNVSRLLAVAFTALLACGDHAGYAQAAVEHWVATWAASQTLVRGTGLGAGRGRADAPPSAAAASTPSPPAPPPAPVTQFPGRRFPIPPNLPSI